MEKKCFGELSKKLEGMSDKFQNGEIPEEFEQLYLKEIPEIVFEYEKESLGLTQDEIFNRVLFLKFVEYLEFIGKILLKDLNEEYLINNRVWCIRTGLLHIALDYKKMHSENDYGGEILIKSLALRTQISEMAKESRNLLETVEKFFNFCEENQLSPIWVLSALMILEMDLFN